MLPQEIVSEGSLRDLLPYRRKAIGKYRQVEVEGGIQMDLDYYCAETDVIPPDGVMLECRLVARRSITCVKIPP